MAEPVRRVQEVLERRVRLYLLIDLLWLQDSFRIHGLLATTGLQKTEALFTCMTFLLLKISHGHCVTPSTIPDPGLSSSNHYASCTVWNLSALQALLFRTPQSLVYTFGKHLFSIVKLGRDYRRKIEKTASVGTPDWPGSSSMLFMKHAVKYQLILVEAQEKYL
ncbi:hypothetical protein CEXT_313721 [Caerostris extrusa]|uniref:Uncharacterized protein n=1 Tax=Caerostris extrusa TaxID=172846 RepID=A0AAV4N1A9_CAEEX|nr:hypothetical protein CEXT_313721 [Caerostris extrusa]